MDAENDLVIMTFNVLVHNEHPDRVVTAIRASNADVVGLQELNPAIADAIGRDLGHDYPYQILAPDESAAGMGVISRYPLHPTGETIPGAWLGAPQILALDFGARRVTALNLHPVSSTANPSTTRREARARAGAAAAVVAYVRAHPYPLIVTTDFNAGDQNEPYAIVTRALGDAWREAGWGLGHTFPGASSPGSSRPRVLGVAVPQWLVRIDYVFHSRDWRARWARIGPWDGISDHRPVLTCLTLLD